MSYGLVLKHKDGDRISFLLKETYLERWSNGNLYFWTKRSQSPIGYISKEGSLKIFNYMSTEPLDWEWIKSWKWKSVT